MSASGSAVFYLFPNADTRVYVLSLGQCLTEYAEAPVVDARDAVSLGGRMQRSLGHYTRAVTLTLERIRSSAEGDRKTLARRLQVLERHLQRGGRVAFSASDAKARALFLGGPIARDDTTLPLGADPFSSLLPGALAEGDWVRLLTPDADGTEEYAQLDAAPTASEITLVDGVVFAANEPVLVSWEYCWPSLYRPAESLHEPLTVATKGRHWQLSLTLHVDLYSLFAPQLSNGDVFDVLGSAGLSLDDVVDMPGNPLDQGGAERVWTGQGGVQTDLNGPTWKAIPPERLAGLIKDGR